jgi:hypothetical protein
MSDVLDNIYLPNFEKRKIRESEPYQLLKENNIDPSSLEGYYDTEAKKHATPIEFTELNSINDKEEWLSKHVNKEVYKEYFSNIGDFFVETGKDTALSLATAVVNGADVAVNMMPLMVKALDKFPLPGSAPGTLSTETEDKLMQTATTISNNLDGVRNYLNDFKKDDNFVSQMIGIASQDMLYSIPIYNKLKAIGMPKYPAFFLSGGIGGAIGIEKKVLGGESTFVHHFFEKDLVELKNLVGILPNTPYDKIADEAIQALEYGVFSAALPGVIDALKFMKKNIPAFASTAVGTTALTIGNEAEANPIKAIINAVDQVPIFKSAVKEAAETKITKGNADQIYNTIKNTPGVKEAELKWLDLEESLKARSQIKKAPLTKDEVLEIIDNNKVDISEVSFGGNAARLSDDLEQKILDFEQKVEKAARAQDLGYADINYDVYPYSVKTARNNRIDEVRKETSMSFSQLDDMLLGLPINSKTFLDDFTTKSGQIEIHKFTDNLNNTPVYVGRELAEELINEKKIVRDIPAALNTPGTPRYTRSRVLEFEPLEIEKFLIEREKRLFMRENNAPKFERYTEPGGDDYTELVFKVKRGGMDVGIPTTRYDDQIRYTPYKNPSHMNVKSEIAHVRFKTRYGEGLDDGQKILAVEEMQSDFGIRTAKIKKADMEQIDELSGQQLGFMAGEAFPGNKFTVEEAQKKLKGNVKAYDFPFKNNWYELTIKRLARYAADNGFDAIAIPKGELAANRYGSSIDKIKTVSIQKNRFKEFPDTDEYVVRYFDEAKKDVQEKYFVKSALPLLEKEIGPKAFKQLMDAEKANKFTVGKGEFEIPIDKPIVIGSGSGKYRLYSETIPSFMKKYGKKWNAKVYDDNFRVDDLNIDSEYAPDRFVNIPVTVMKITPEMKQGVQSNSQPLFELFGTVGLSTWGAKTVSDNIENNIISEKTF